MNEFKLTTINYSALSSVKVKFLYTGNNRYRRRNKLIENLRIYIMVKDVK